MEEVIRELANQAKVVAAQAAAPPPQPAATAKRNSFSLRCAAGSMLLCCGSRSITALLAAPMGTPAMLFETRFRNPLVVCTGRQAPFQDHCLISRVSAATSRL